MRSAGTDTDWGASFNELTVTTVPPVEFEVTREQMWSMPSTYETLTSPTSSRPRSAVPLRPANVPSQSTASSWAPTLKLKAPATLAMTLVWSSSVMTMKVKPGSSLVQVILYTPGSAGLVTSAPPSLTSPSQSVFSANMV